MDRDRRGGNDLMRRAAMNYYLGRDEDRQPGGERQEQWIPVNVYETEEDVVVVAPMPGVESDNIDIEVHGHRMTLRASMRGPDQAQRRYFVHEWTYGPYERTVELPTEVDAGSANASHGNGVLVVSMPKAVHARSIRIPLRQVTSERATHQGHSGHK
jgi:HSP20 family protein